MKVDLIIEYGYDQLAEGKSDVLAIDAMIIIAVGKRPTRKVFYEEDRDRQLMWLGLDIDEGLRMQRAALLRAIDQDLEISVGMCNDPNAEPL